MSPDKAWWSHLEAEEVHATADYLEHGRIPGHRQNKAAVVDRPGERENDKLLADFLNNKADANVVLNAIKGAQKNEVVGTVQFNGHEQELHVTEVLLPNEGPVFDDALYTETQIGLKEKIAERTQALLARTNIGQYFHALTASLTTNNDWWQLEQSHEVVDAKRNNTFTSSPQPFPITPIRGSIV